MTDGLSNILGKPVRTISELMSNDHFKITTTPEKKRAIQAKKKLQEAVQYTPNNQFEDYSSY
jgi:hypothetical protein